MRRVPANRLHLFIPGLLGPLKPLESAKSDLSVPMLEKLLSRGQTERCPGHDYLTTLFSLFGYPPSAEADLPIGAVNIHADAEASEGCWMRADPVHLRPDRDRLLLFHHERLDITPEEADELSKRFNAHFNEEPFRLLAPEPEHWYLQLDHCPDLKTHHLDQVVGHHIEPFMPKGEDARRWRQWLNEMQMLLFQSPVNQRRESSGRLTINGIWLSGVGRLPTMGQCPFAKVMGDERSARGLARLAHIEIEPVPGEGETLWNPSGDNLMVLTDLVQPVLDADPIAWREAIQRVEQMAVSAIAELQRNKQAELLIYPCNGQAYHVTHQSLRRFWRRSKKLTEHFEEP